METRIKWLHSPSLSGRNLGLLIAGIQAAPFTQESERGFIPTEIRGRSVSGRYIERISGKKIFIDPFGQKIEVPFITFETTTFRIGLNSPQIEITNPPRSLKRFFNTIASMSETTFTITPVSVNVVDWIDLLTSKLGDSYVSEIKCDDLSLSPSLVADMTFSGGKDVLQSTRQFLKSNFRNVSYALVNFDLGNQSLQVALYSTGIAKFFPECDPRIANIFRESINSTANGKG
jgi:hypothetical protein